MRSRDRILSNLESAYREAFDRAKEKGAAEEMARLDFEFQRDQIHLEVLLDIRNLLTPKPQPLVEDPPSLLKEGTALVEKAEKLKRITKLR